MTCGVICQFNIAEAKMTLYRVVLRCSKLAVELVGADVRRILISHAASVEGLVGNGDGIFAGFGGRFADGKGVLPDEILGLKTDKLHDDAGFAHSMLAAVPTAAAEMF